MSKLPCYSIVKPTKKDEKDGQQKSTKRSVFTFTLTLTVIE